MKDFVYDTLSKKAAEQERGADIWEKVRAKGIETLFFDTEDFHAYHQRNCEQLYRITVLSGDKISGFCYAGRREDLLVIGYSAPFSNLYLADGGSGSLGALTEGIGALAANLGTGVRITLPPAIYDGQLPLKVGTLLDSGYRLSYAHVNHYFDLGAIRSTEEFVSERPHSYRKNLKRAMRSQLAVLDPSEEESLLRRAYEVIAANRAERGYPLSMKREQIETIAAMEGAGVDPFVLTLPDGTDIAAAIVFRVSKRVYQVVYWGNLSEYTAFRPMELLSCHLISYYRDRAAGYLDIGPSTAEGRISQGLLRFKETIGCRQDLKMVLERPLR